MAKNFGIAFEIGAKLASNVARSFSSLHDKIRTTGTAFGDLTRQSRQLGRALDLRGQRDELAAQLKGMDRTTDAAKALRRQLERVSNQYRSSRAVVSEHSGAARDWAENQRRLNAELATTQRRMQRLNTLESERNNRQDMVGQAMGVAAAGASLAMPIMTSVRFEDQMLRVAAVSNATHEQLADLTERAKELGRTTRFTASQVGEGMQYLAMAGFNARQQIAAIGGVLNVSAAAGADLGTTSDIVSNALTGFGLAADQAARVGDVLTKTFTSSNTTIESLGETLKYVAPVAKAAGANIEFAAAIAGVMGDAGIQGSMAGTAMRSMFTRLVAPAKNAQKHMKDMGLTAEQMQEIMKDPSTIAVAEQMKKLGISVADEQGNLRDWMDILTELSMKMDNLTEQERLQAATDIFGKPALSGGLAVLDAMKRDEAYMVAQLKNMREQGATEAELLEYKLQFRNKLYDRYNKNLLASQEGTARQVAERMESGTGGALRSLDSAWEGSMIAFGEAFAPILKDIAGALTTTTNAVTGFIETFPRLSSGLALGVTGLTALSAGVIAFKFAFSGVRSLITATTLAMNWLGTSSLWLAAKTKIVTAAQWLLNIALNANPIGLVIAGVAALASWFTYCYMQTGSLTGAIGKMWDQFKSVVPIMNVVGAVFSGVFQFITDLFSGMSLYDAGVRLIATLGEGIMDMWDDVVAPIKELGQWVGILDEDDENAPDTQKLANALEEKGRAQGAAVVPTFDAASYMPATAEAQKALAPTNAAAAIAPTPLVVDSSAGGMERPTLPAAGDFSVSGMGDMAAGMGSSMSFDMHIAINGVTDGDLAKGVFNALEHNKSRLENVISEIVNDQVRLAYGS